MLNRQIFFEIFKDLEISNDRIEKKINECENEQYVIAIINTILNLKVKLDEFKNDCLKQKKKIKFDFLHHYTNIDRINIQQLNLTIFELIGRKYKKYSTKTRNRILGITAKYDNAINFGLPKKKKPQKIKSKKIKRKKIKRKKTSEMNWLTKNSIYKPIYIGQYKA
ncbi:MAG: hypothetical protein JST07_06150 [Bacteroidetes bacterium]|nr:hypothetical protein [Bacteroidota bacterium]